MNSRPATVFPNGELSSLVFERRLPYRIETVWAAIAEPKHRAGWFGDTEIEPYVGGRIKIVGSGCDVPEPIRTVTGRILVWDPPHVLEHEWNQPIVEKSVVRYELTADGSGTILKLTHGLISLCKSPSFGPGTHAYLDRLEAYLSGEELPDWGQRFVELQAVYGRE